MLRKIDRDVKRVLIKRGGTSGARDTRDAPPRPPEPPDARAGVNPSLAREAGSAVL